MVIRIARSVKTGGPATGKVMKKHNRHDSDIHFYDPQTHGWRE